MPESNEQTLVERLRSWELSLTDQAADALASQAVQITELQAEVERTNLGWEQTSIRLGAALREIADLKRALDTARDDALEEAAKVAYERGGPARRHELSDAIRALQTKDQPHGQ